MKCAESLEKESEQLMAIVKMKKLRLMAVRNQKEELLTQMSDDIDELAKSLGSTRETAIEDISAK